MAETINAKTLRKEMAKILERARKGERFTVIYRSRPVCRIVPLEDVTVGASRVEEDPLYGAGAVGESTDGRTAADHDEFLYGSRGK